MRSILTNLQAYKCVCTIAMVHTCRRNPFNTLAKLYLALFANTFCDLAHKIWMPDQHYVTKLFIEYCVYINYNETIIPRES